MTRKVFFSHQIFKVNDIFIQMNVSFFLHSLTFLLVLFALLFFFFFFFIAWSDSEAFETRETKLRMGHLVQSIDTVMKNTFIYVLRCQWKVVTCHVEYFHSGQITDGRTFKKRSKITGPPNSQMYMQ